MNYWHILEEARTALAAGRYRDAEEQYEAAIAARERSPRRVFFTETSVNLARRLADALTRRERPDAEAGRWERAVEALRRDFRTEAEAAVARARRAADLRPEDNPETNQPVLAAGLYLVIASRLAPRDPAAAVPLVKALLRTARHTGRAFDRDLLRADLPLTAEDRLWLARTGDEVLVNAPAGDGHDGFAPEAWARTLLELLDPAHFPAGGLEDERRWWIATLSDHHLADPREILARYDECLARASLPHARAAAARARCVELLGNVTGEHFPVPRYREARAVLAAADDAEPGTPEHDRLGEARAVLDHRRPRGQAWASASTAADGRVQLVLWWGECPRDVASWGEGEDLEALREWLAPAEGRLLWAEPGPAAPLVAALGAAACGRALSPLFAVLLEPRLPAEALTPTSSWRLGLARSGPWRDDWRQGRGHPRLVPPAADGRLDVGQTQVEPALAAGLLWLACLRRVDEADPALRAGLGEIGRRGDAAAAFIHDCAVLGSPAKRSLDEGFAAWTLPLLWTRPDPLPVAAARDDEADRPDLAGNDVAVVNTGRPGRALAAWGGRDRRWRVVLDRLERATELGEIAREAYGPVTLVPAGGCVHDLAAALAWLDELARTPREGDAALLAVVHWTRLVESHNGDLLDVLRLRPRPRGAHPVNQLYAEAVARLPREAPVATTDVAGASWGAQFAQRVRKSGLVAGVVDDLPEDPADLDASWGVFEGSDASWVFLDSAAIHWQLWRRDPGLPARLHARLVTRGRRHASVVVGGGVLAADLAACFDGLLAPYGRPYHVILPDLAAPRLRLAARGPVPGARLLATESWCAPLQHLATATGHDTLVLAAADGVGGEFWRWAQPRYGSGAWRLVTSTREADFAHADRARLVVPRLACFDDSAAAAPVATAGTAAAWRQADAGRREATRRARILASLELNALLAAPVAVVEVLDGRWWRRLPEGTTDPVHAAALLGGAADLVDLPSGDAARDLGAAVTAWLAEHEAAAATRRLPLLTGQGGDEPTPGVHLHPGDAGPVWSDLARWLLRAWEAGEPIGRLFLLGDAPPAGAAALVGRRGWGGGAAPGAPGGGAGRAPGGPLQWLRPRDVARAQREAAAGLQPDAVLVSDLGGWLPGAEAAGDDTAHALRWLAGCGARWIVLAGADLSPAWEAFLAGRLGAVMGPRAPHPGGWRELRRGEVLRPARTCPHCGQVAPAVADLACAACGYDLAADAAWREPAAPELELAEALASLARQRDLGRDRALEVWSAAEISTAVLAHAGVTALADPDRVETWALADGRRWRRRPPDRGRFASEGAEAVRVGTPTAPEDFSPLSPPGSRQPLVLLYAEAPLGEAPGGAEPAATRRLLRLLREHGEALAAADREVWPSGVRGEAVVPLHRLARLCGLDPAPLARSLATLRWTARLAGVGRAAAAPEAPGPRLLVRRPFAGIEHDLRDLRRDLPATFGLLGAGVAGAWRETVLPAAADEAAASRRARLDVFLHLASQLTLGGEPRRLGYRTDAGEWFSDRRWFLWVGDPAEAMAWCERQLAAFEAAARALLAHAVPIDDGYLVAPEPDDPQPVWPAGALVWGQELGYWHAVGLDDPWQIPLAELDRLRETAVSGPEAPGAALLVALAAERAHWRRALAATPAEHPVVAPADAPSVPEVEAAGGATSRRSWLRRTGETDPAAAAVQAVAAIATASSRGVLALVGHAGTGRHDTLLAGLERALAGPDAPDSTTVWCPDAATAGRLHLAAMKRRPGWRLDLRVAGTPGEPGLEARDRAPGGKRLTVIAEMQRLPRELRYQLLDQSWDDRLLLTVDPAESAESWEDLFITAPKPEQIRTLDVQRLQARRLWEEVAPLLGLRDARAQRRDRGSLESRGATNLAECVSAIVDEVGAGRLGRSLDVVSPLAVDVAELTRGLREQDWLAVSRRELDEYLLPGVLELLAAAADVATLAAHDGGERRPALLSPACVPPALADACRLWLRGAAGSAPATVGELWTRWQRTPWGRACSGDAAAAARTAAFARAWSAVELATLLEHPIVVAWRDRLGEILERNDLLSPRPVARLATAEQPTGQPSRGLVYVCAGVEPESVHYRVLSRVSDQLLVLWHEKSPLASEAEESPHR